MPHVAGRSSGRVRQHGLGRMAAMVLVGPLLLTPYLTHAPSALAEDPPQVTGSSPELIPFAGGVRVELFGSALDGVEEVTFDGVQAQLIGAGPRRLLLVAPPARLPGPIDVVLLDAAGNAYPAAVDLAYDIPAPSISALNPSSGDYQRNFPVTVTGTNLQKITEVRVNGLPVGIISVTANSVTFNVPPARRPGQAQVVLSGSNGQAVATLVRDDPPRISGPQIEVPTSGGRWVEIAGENFEGISSVEVDGQQVRYYLSAPEAGKRSVRLEVPRRSFAGPAQLTLFAPSGTARSGETLVYVPPPTIWGISPASVHVARGELVRVSGSGLDGVSVRSSRSGDLVVQGRDPRGEWITFLAPSSIPGPVIITVANAFGADTATLTYIGDPEITVMWPVEGPSRGGQAITMRGSQLDLVTGVRFGSEAAQILTSTADAITVRAPPSSVHGIGIGEVEVTLSTAKSARLPISQTYLYLDPPSLDAVQPSSGEAMGGDRIRLLGSNLNDVDSVQFDGRNARIVSRSSVELVVLLPSARVAGSQFTPLVGPVDISVSSADGSATLPLAFTYVDTRPVLREIAPDTGSLRGGGRATVRGANLDAVRSVSFGDVEATIVSRSEFSLVVTIPPTQATSTTQVKVSATNDAGSSSSMLSYTYVPAPPTFYRVSPGSGPWIGGTLVRILGVNLDEVTEVKFGSAMATILGRSSEELEVLVPSAVDAGAALDGGESITVEVRNPDGAFRLRQSFRYSPPAPVITQVTPAAGRLAGGTQVTITGSNFISSASVSIGGRPVNIRSRKLTKLVVDTPPAASSGPVDVRVVTGGGEAVRVDGFEYVGPPSIAGVSPGLGPMAGGTRVVVRGANLGAVSGVRFGDGPVVPVVSAADGEVVALAPASSVSGPVDVTVVGPDGSAVARDGFAYLDVPSIRSVQPDSGGLDGGDQVTITGAGFAADARVSFGGSGARVVSQTASKLVVVAPPAASAGLVDVRVVTGGGAATRADAFEYLAASPVIDAIGPRNGPLGGGNQVRIAGRNLESVDRVTFGSVSAAIKSQSQTTIEVLVPRGRQPGQVDVVVTGPQGSDRVAGGYAYQESQEQDDDRITVTGMAPASGPMGGGTSITVTGSRMDLVTGANMGGRPARIVAKSASSITVVSPSADADYVVNLVLEFAKGSVEAGRFQYTS